MSTSDYRYEPLSTTSTPLPVSTTRPLVDSPYVDEDDERLKRRNINPLDHPATDINPRTSNTLTQPPPAGLLATSLLTLLVGLVLLGWAMGVVSGSGGVWWVWRAMSAVCGSFLCASGVYSAWEWWVERTNGGLRASGGYTFPNLRQ